MITRKWEKVKDNALFAIIEICTFISLLFWSGEGVLTALNILSTLPFRLVWTGRAHNVHPLVPRGKQTPALGPSYHRHICIEQKYIISVTISLFIVSKWKIRYYYNYTHVHMLHIYFDFTVISNLSVVGKMISVLPTSISTKKRGSTEIRGKISLIYGKHKTGHLEVYITTKYTNNRYHILLLQKQSSSLPRSEIQVNMLILVVVFDITLFLQIYYYCKL